jgi:hypothetical protein
MDWFERLTVFEDTLIRLRKGPIRATRVSDAQTTEKIAA